jgi:MFS family permease
MFSAIVAAIGGHFNPFFYYIRFAFSWSLFSPVFVQEYHWDNTIKANLLTSFFWGYVITQLPAGQLAQRFGPKILMTGSLFVCSLFTILMPLAAEVGDWGLLCATRVIQGLAQVSHWFCIVFHVNNWI